MSQPSSPAPTSRRDFLKVTAATAAAATLAVGPYVHAAGSDTLRVGLIGCGSPRGGRGRGAAEQCLRAGPNVKLVAMADLFRDHLDFTLNYLKKKKDLSGKIDVPEERCFVGFDAYKQVCALKEVDLVLLAAPPGFRPLHLRAAVDAGKHIFAEKPVAVDGPGVREVLKAVEDARAKKLSLVSGLCWRYHPGMRETFKRVHGGAIGDILTLQCTYNTGGLWKIDRTPQMSDVEWQCRNWLYFTWLSGDHNVEQHIHSLDKMAWAMKDEYPVSCTGVGGRQVRTAPVYGHIFDHHSVVYEYANGVRCFSQCRQQDGCAPDVSDQLVGTRGVCHIDAMRAFATIKPHGSGSAWRSSREGENMYQVEHNELVASIRAGKPINNGDYMTKSTLMAIMGRMATYTGQKITWDMALHSKERLGPDKYEFGSLPTPEVARPGVTKFV
ncbi:MAG TPA: Gfo/Idh/MocA family oxidoreductase [Gemmataceae bacterium]|nr:Gfo/Idh/MocA family oxidoreductase [Gemmataceae bacterium]